MRTMQIQLKKLFMEPYPGIDRKGVFPPGIIIWQQVQLLLHTAYRCLQFFRFGCFSRQRPLQVKQSFHQLITLFIQAFIIVHFRKGDLLLFDFVYGTNERGQTAYKSIIIKANNNTASRDELHIQDILIGTPMRTAMGIQSSWRLDQQQEQQTNDKTAKRIKIRMLEKFRDIRMQAEIP